MRVVVVWEVRDRGAPNRARAPVVLRMVRFVRSSRAGCLYYIAAFLHEVLTFIPYRRHLMAFVATGVAVSWARAQVPRQLSHVTCCRRRTRADLLHVARLHPDVRPRRRVPRVHVHLYVHRGHPRWQLWVPWLGHSPSLCARWLAVDKTDVLNGFIVVSAWRALRKPVTDEKLHQH